MITIDLRKQFNTFGESLQKMTYSNIPYVYRLCQLSERFQWFFRTKIDKIDTAFMKRATEVKFDMAITAVDFLYSKELFNFQTVSIHVNQIESRAEKWFSVKFELRPDKVPHRLADFWHVILEWCPKYWMHILRFEFSLVSKIEEWRFWRGLEGRPCW